MQQLHRLVLACLLALALAPADAQAADAYDVVIKGGRVLDPRNKIDGTFDVAIAGGKIARISPDIPVAGVPTVVRAAGMVVTPGLVDIHAHVFHGPELHSEYAFGPRALPPDGFTFRAGVTTVVDAGGSGWRNFPLFKRQVIDIAKTRVLAFLNIVGSGMGEGELEQNLADMDARLCALRASENRDTIVGIKTAHFRGPEWLPVDRAVEAGRIANIPVMVDFGEFVPERPFRDLVGKHLRPGDIYTHTYLGVVPMLDGKGRVNSFMFEARKRGVIFDVGHGGGSFVFRLAVPAMKQGFRPDTLSTDLHINSMNSGMKDLSNLMSKFMAMGMPLEEAVLRATAEPARVIKRPELGQIGVGAAADVAVFSVRKGKFGFTDVDGGRLDGDQKLECELTVRAGNVVWDLNGISKPGWQELKPKVEALEPWPPKPAAK